MSYYLHKVKGRIRLRTPIIKNNEAAAELIKDFIMHLGGVTSVNTNTLTGSIVINYNPAVIDAEEIVQALEKEGYFNSRLAVGCETILQKHVEKIGKQAGRAIFGLVSDQVLRGTGLSFLSLII
ncbi:hypothetical protein Thein_1609 [Thermodesulfatator indicus DSM 15286]|uniref:HMA domain-containing protein n=1 Tax=Thermodesulfatator indicus (strain DSM 15286 / JCM 11887 / CIR29812) TaxID=667014 RepID=F8A9A4_THEID|nr:cation transporter [Thermodesulfatator indicus]AEH45469.1 hypothetical protein Thein_1609 [Thermodesulfatator indicus DSM 15286]